MMKYACMYWYLAENSMSGLWGGGVPNSDSGYTRLRLGVPTSIINLNDKVCQETISTERELYTILIQHTDMNKGKTRVGKNIIKLENDIAPLSTGGTRSARTEHSENWPLPVREKQYPMRELTWNSSPFKIFSGFRNCRFEPRTQP